VNAVNGASAWRTVEGEGPVGSSHGAVADLEQVHDAQIVGSGPKGKMPDREAVVADAEEGRRKSLSPV